MCRLILLDGFCRSVLCQRFRQRGRRVRPADRDMVQRHPPAIADILPVCGHRHGTASRWSIKNDSQELSEGLQDSRHHSHDLLRRDQLLGCRCPQLRVVGTHPFCDRGQQVGPCRGLIASDEANGHHTEHKGECWGDEANVIRWGV